MSIVVPIFNEDAVIRNTHQRIFALAESLCRKSAIADYEIIYVDDGSRDESLAILKELLETSPRIKVLSFSRNFGHQIALAAGITHSSGDAVVSLDADLQDPPELIEDMIEKYKMGYDIVYAVRKERNTDSLLKRGSARFFYRAMKLMGVDLIYDHADFRLISHKVTASFRRIGEVNIFLRGIFPFLGFKHKIVYYDRHERAAGETKYPLRKMLSFAWEGVTSFSIMPLRVASFAGLLIFLASLALIFWATYWKIAGRTIPGWTSIIIPMSFIGGLNILFLGLIGEYIGKIYIEVKKRPLYIIKEKYNFDGYGQ